MTVAELLALYTPDVRDLALKTRALILEVMPDTLEQVDDSAQLIAYGYDRTYTGLICGIIPQKTYVNLMFSHGATMPDPDQLLTGTGKKARHIKIQTADALEHPGVRALLDAGVAATQAHMAQKNTKQ
jgi:hypothetical protein